MNKSVSTIIQEMKRHRKDFMKRSTPYRQLSRAIKQLEKLEDIEQIIKDYGLSETDLTNDDLSDFEKDILREVLEQEVEVWK